MRDISCMASCYAQKWILVKANQLVVASSSWSTVFQSSLEWSLLAFIPPIFVRKGSWLMMQFLWHFKSDWRCCLLEVCKMDELDLSVEIWVTQLPCKVNRMSRVHIFRKATAKVPLKVDNVLFDMFFPCQRNINIYWKQSDTKIKLSLPITV